MWKIFKEFIERTGPFFLVLALNVVGLAILDPDEFLGFLPFLFLYLTPFLGKDTTLPAAVAFGFNPIMAAVSLTVADIAMTLLFLRNWDIIMKIPILGKLVDKIHKKFSIYLVKRPKIKDLAFTGLTLLVAVPFRGLGAFEGTIVSRIIGLSEWKTINAIALGSLISSIAIALASQTFIPILKRYPLILAGTIFGVILTGYISYVLSRNEKEKNRKKKEEQDENTNKVKNEK